MCAAFWFMSCVSLPLRIVYNAVKFATGAVGLVFVVFAVIGIVNAAQGIAKELPLVGKVKILK